MARQPQYKDWSHERLVEEVKKLRKRKKYGIVWEHKPEDVVERCKSELPILKEVKSKEVITDESAPVNLLIEGDNYHALSVLNYTHKGRISVIYIDPPYNTGAQDWKYNNDYVDVNDAWRHSKWLSMMSARLRFAKHLLKRDGALIIAIDDYEVNHLGVLLEELFPEHERDLIVVEHHPQGAGSNTVSRTHEYAFVCTPKGVGFKGRKNRDEEGAWSLKRSGQGENNWRENRPKQFFAVLVDEAAGKVVGIGPEIPRELKTYPTGKTKDGYLRVYPIDREGKERVWRYNRSTMQLLIDKGMIKCSAKGALTVRKEVISGIPVFSVWKDSRYNAGTHGSSLLTKIMGTTNTFQYPKSLWTVYDMLNLVHSEKDAIFLDFFAGSGTTGHAVMLLNKEDGGKRTFILATDNENKIAENVTLPRIKKVIKGVRDLPDITGFNENVRYFRTAFVGANPTDANKEDLTKQATEMLCVREGTYDLVKDTRQYKIYKNAASHTGIVLDQLALPAFKKVVEKIPGKWSVYVFSLGDDTFDDEFAEYDSRVRVTPIPEAILRVYRRIFGEKITYGT